MLKKIVLLASLAVLLAPVPAAQAWSIKVFVQYGEVDGCRVDEDRISYRFVADGKVDYNGIAPPKRIRAAYQIIDKTTGWTIASRVINLKKSTGYKKRSKRFTVPAGHEYSMRVNFTYRVGGRTRQFGKSSTDLAPTREELDQLGVVYC